MNPTSGSDAQAIFIFTCFTDEKHEADDDPSPSSPPSFLLPSPCIHSKRPRVCRHHAHMLKTHVRVVPAYTGVFSVSHTTHHTPPQPPHHTETDRERDRDKERRGDEREEDREDKTTRRENREDSFSVWWCMAVVSWCSDFLVTSVCARDLSLLKSVKYDSI